MNTSNALHFLESYVPGALSETKTPGCSIAVTVGNEVVYAGGFGLRDREQGLAATPDTLYGVGSCTKAFVATAILLLSERGALNLDDPVDSYLPLKLHAAGGPIRIRHLLSHSSGLPALSTSESLIQQGLGAPLAFPLADSDDFYRWVNSAQKEMTPGPGERFFYSNESYRMLGHIVQILGGMPFHEFIAHNILEPLEMQRSTLVRSRYEADSDGMRPYLTKPDGSVVPAAFPYPDVDRNPGFAFMHAAGGLISSALEMSKFVRANFSASPSRLLSPQSLQAMQTAHIARPLSPYGENGYGYGWFITKNFLGMKMVAHGGSIDVSTAHVAFLPERDMGVVILSNSSGLPLSAIAEAVLATLLGADPSVAIPALAVKTRMAALAGTYEAYRSSLVARVFSKGGLLYLEQKDEFQDTIVPLIPEDDMLRENRFYIFSDGARQPVEFEIMPDGTDVYIERNRYHRVK